MHGAVVALPPDYVRLFRQQMRKCGRSAQCWGGTPRNNTGLHRTSALGLQEASDEVISGKIFENAQQVKERAEMVVGL